MTHAPAYDERFKDRGEVDAYEAVEYGPDSYATHTWRLQQPVVERLVRDHARAAGPLRALDFACGTGRVTQFLQPLVASIHGVDISPEMLAVAARRCPGATLACGDICADPAVAGSGYTLVTAFRFFLNTDPALRGAVLAALRRAIDPDAGLFLFNLHGSARSLRHPLIRRRLRQAERRGEPLPRDVMLNEVHPDTMRTLLAEHGFAVASVTGIGLVPAGLYRGPLRPLASWIDRAGAGGRLAGRYGIDLLFACRPA